MCVNGKLRKLHRMINSVYMNKFKPFGLRGSMVSILFIIGKYRDVNQKTIADVLILDQSTMSRDLSKLVKNGLIKTKKGKDSRNSELELTEKGCLLIEEITPIWNKLHCKVEEILGQYNIQHIDSITEAIKTNLEELK